MHPFELGDNDKPGVIDATREINTYWQLCGDALSSSRAWPSSSFTSLDPNNMIGETDAIRKRRLLWSK